MDRDGTYERQLAKLRKDLGEVFLTALADPETVEILLNADGTLWQERLGQPLAPIGTMSRSSVEAAMRTIAAYHHATITRDNPTTVLNALIRELTDRFPKERLIIIEDTAEIQCAAKDSVQYHTSPDRTMTHLVRMALRMRPDRILVGEVRGPEALDLLMAWNTGHEGGIATLHANNAVAGLTRLSTLVSMHRSVVEGHAKQIDKHHCDQETVVCL